MHGWMRTVGGCIQQAGERALVICDLNIVDVILILIEKTFTDSKVLNTGIEY